MNSIKLNKIEFLSYIQPKISCLYKNIQKMDISKYPGVSVEEVNDLIDSVIEEQMSKKHYEGVLLAVRKNGMALQFADERFKLDKFVVKTAVKQNGLALQFAHKTLKSIKSIVETAIKQNGMALQFVSDYMKDRFDIVPTAVKQNGMALQFASDDMKSNFGIVWIAVKQNGLALEFADEKLKNHFGVVEPAVEQNGLALQFANERLKNDHFIIEAAIRQNYCSLQFVNDLDLYHFNSFVRFVLKDITLSFTDFEGNKYKVKLSLNEYSDPNVDFKSREVQKYAAHQHKELNGNDWKFQFLLPDDNEDEDIDRIHSNVSLFDLMSYIAGGFNPKEYELLIVWNETDDEEDNTA